MTEVVFNADSTGPDAPVAETKGASAPARPEGLPENFDSVEALVASYKAAQAELTKTKQGKVPAAEDGQQDTSDKVTEQQTDETEEKAPEDTPSQLPENLVPFSEEFAKDGKLSEESYTKLTELGYSKEVVDAYIKGVTGTSYEAPSVDDVVSIQKAVGGEAKFAEMQTWASENLSDDDLDAYNAGIANKATARMAVEWLKGRVEAAEGFTPAVTIEGNTAVTPSVKGFADTAEMARAMRDPLYKAGDKAYHAMIDARLKATKAF